MYKAMLYSTVLGQFSAVRGCLMGAEAGGTGIIRGMPDKTELGEIEFPNIVWECCMKRLLPSRWPCLNRGSSVQGGRISTSQGLPAWAVDCCGSVE